MAELLVGAAANSWLVGGARVGSELQSVLLGGVARSAAVDAAAAGEAADAAPAQGRAAPDDDSAAKPSKRARTEPAAADDWVSTFLPGGASTLAKLSKARASLGDLSNHSFMRGRALANEYEALGGSAFVCRSALKLAALDAALALAIGCPTTAGGTFTFADLCGAPGGFTEYVLGVCTSRAAKCQGFGISLLGSNAQGTATEWKLRSAGDMLEAVGRRFTMSKGVDGTGDIYSKANRDDFVERTFSTLKARVPSRGGGGGGGSEKGGGGGGGDVGLQLVVADGGFDSARNADNQELACARVAFAQASVALRLLRDDGTLVLKLFGSTEPQTLRLVAAVRACFSELCVTKPVTSRPASSERYLVARGFSRKAAAPLLAKLEAGAGDASAHAEASPGGFACSPAAIAAADPALAEHVSRANGLFADAQLKTCEAIVRLANTHPSSSQSTPAPPYHVSEWANALADVSAKGRFACYIVENEVPRRKK